MAALEGDLRALRAELATTRDRLTVLERRHGPRDAAEEAVIPAIAFAVGSARSTAQQLVRLGAVDAALGAALLAADVTSARELGILLARLEGLPIAGYVLCRAGQSRRATVWRLVVGESGESSTLLPDGPID